MLKNLAIVAAVILFIHCKENKEAVFPLADQAPASEIKYASGFSLKNLGSGVTVIEILSPWADAETTFKYALIPRKKMASMTLNTDEYDAIVATPVERLVVTSTTHIPALEALGEIDKLVGFPKTDLISSKAARALIDSGEIRELGNNEQLNTEMVISLAPDLVVGFGVDGRNKAYETLRSSRIPVVYNGDWTEETPLGKAEWVKFFAPFLGKEKEADSIFNSIEASYKEAKMLAEGAAKRPTVLTGGLYKDVWHVAGGQSWMAHFLEDAKADYLWGDTKETGSIPTSLESVLVKADNADFWLNPSMHTSYSEMKEANRHYRQLDAFQNRKIYSNAVAKGPTGGLLFYELAPLRPDLVLKDLVHIFHPELLPRHELIFYKPLM